MQIKRLNVFFWLSFIKVSSFFLLFCTVLYSWFDKALKDFSFRAAAKDRECKLLPWDGLKKLLFLWITNKYNFYMLLMESNNISLSGWNGNVLQKSKRVTRSEKTIFGQYEYFVWFERKSPFEFILSFKHSLQCSEHLQMKMWFLCAHLIALLHTLKQTPLLCFLIYLAFFI